MAAVHRKLAAAYAQRRLDAHSLVMELPSPGSLVGHIAVEDEQAELSWNAVKFSTLSTEGCPDPIETVAVTLGAQSNGEEQVGINVDDLELVAD